MSFFKKLMHYTDPIAAPFVKTGNSKNGSQALQNIGAANANNAEISKLKEDYDKIPTMLRDSYTKASQQAGTYGNTDEWRNGLESEVKEGSRGARVADVNRIQALQRAMGTQESDLFNPDGYNQTQANATSTNLANNPASAPATSAAPAQAQATESQAPAMGLAPNAGPVGTGPTPIQKTSGSSLISGLQSKSSGRAGALGRFGSRGIY